MPRRAQAQADLSTIDSDALLRLDHQLCFALYSSSLAMTKLYKPLLEPLGVTYPQYLVLLALWETDAIGVGELGARLFLDTGTLTPLLKRMEAAGLLGRERDSADERRVVVTLTAVGRELQKPAKLVPTRVACASGCELDELAGLTRRLQSLRDQLSHETDIRAEIRVDIQADSDRVSDPTANASANAGHKPVPSAAPPAFSVSFTRKPQTRSRP